VRAPDADDERVTVGRRARDPADTDAASRAGHIFNDDRLAERRPHAFDQDTTNDISRPTWREWDNDCDGPRRIALRPRDPSRGRPRGSAGGQMQKLSAGKFHFEPPFRSFDHLVGAGSGTTLDMRINWSERS